jgi:hypothetical protein
VPDNTDDEIIVCGEKDGLMQKIDSDGNAMNMYRNDNGQFNIDRNDRDNRNSDNGPREKFLVNSRQS